MSEHEIIKEYCNGEITILWKPRKCVHSGICVALLPKVYRPSKRPWITLENATTEELKQQIAQCPSGALSYRIDDEGKYIKPVQECLQVRIIPNGPVMIDGCVEITHTDGTSATQDGACALCRCGASGRKPFCDGSHVKEGFNPDS